MIYINNRILFCRNEGFDAEKRTIAMSKLHMDALHKHFPGVGVCGDVRHGKIVNLPGVPFVLMVTSEHDESDVVFLAHGCTFIPPEPFVFSDDDVVTVRFNTGWVQIPHERDEGVKLCEKSRCTQQNHE